MTPAAPLPTAAGSSAPTSQQPLGRPSGGIHNSPQGAPYSLNDILALLHYVGFNNQQAPRMAAIVMAESGGDPNAQHTNQDGSVDRGLFQINDRAHPGVSDACAYDPVCAAQQSQAIWKGSGYGAWSTWDNGSAQGNLTAAEAAQRTNAWKRLQSQFANDRLGQAGNASAPNAATRQKVTNAKLFDCSNGGVSTVLGVIPTGVSLPDIGCYMESAFVFTTYAVGGLILVGAGLLMLVSGKNPASMGLKAVAGAGPAGAASGLAQARETRIAGQSERRLALAESESQRKAQPKPPSPRTEIDLKREQRLQQQADRRAADVETKAQKAKRKVDEATAYRIRAEGFATRQRAKNPAGIGGGFTIGGKEYDVGSLVDISQRYQDELPDRMKG